jgi:hypothetical protein
MLHALEHAHSGITDFVRIPELLSFDESLAGYGLTAADIALSTLRIHRGETVALHQAVPPRLLQTAEVAQFKQWIGVPDELIDRHSPENLPVPPDAPWTRGRDVSPETITAAEWTNIQLAAKAYLFGHSAPVASYAPAIELFFGPFEADLYAIPHIVIEKDARLIVSARPAVLLVDTLDIHHDGRLDVTTISRIFVRSLRKLSFAF